MDSNVSMIAKALSRLQKEGSADDSFAVFIPDEEKNIYIQCHGEQGDPKLYAEAVGNTYLKKRNQLNARKTEMLRALGWKLSHRSGNFRQILIGGDYRHRLSVAQLFLRTFRKVYNIPSECAIRTELTLPEKGWIGSRENWGEMTPEEIATSTSELLEPGKTLAISFPKRSKLWGKRNEEHVKKKKAEESFAEKAERGLMSYSPNQEISVEGGPGETMETAFIIKGIREEPGLYDMEQAILDKMFGERFSDWNLASRWLVPKGEQPFHRFTVTTSKGQTRFIYFNVTDFWSQENRLHRRLKEKLCQSSVSEEG